MTKLLLFILVSLSTQASEIGPFKAWDNCPGNLEDLNSHLMAWSNNDLIFSKTDKATLTKYLWQHSWRSNYLEFFAPYLLPASPRADVAKSCWVYYESFRTSKATIKASSYESWKACLSTQYKTPPALVKKVLSCLDTIYLRDER